MSTLLQVNPETFVNPSAGKPANGRGAWSKVGIGFDYRYALSVDIQMRIGTRAEVSLDHWAVAAGCYTIQKRLVELDFMDPVLDSEAGIFGPRTKAAVIDFQKMNKDPDGGRQLDADGTVGKSDARALFTPIIRNAEARYSIPDSLLLGETNHESMLDPGALGYYIYYPDFRGVDRGMSQINSKAQYQIMWLEAFDAEFCLDWSAKRLRTYFDQYRKSYPNQTSSVLWDAAVCAHNNPSAAARWASTGVPPTEAAALYVASVKTARY